MKFTNQKDLRRAFWESVPGVIRDCYRVTYRQNDYSATVRCMWVDFIDEKVRSGEISEELARRASL